MRKIEQLLQNKAYAEALIELKQKSRSQMSAPERAIYGILLAEVKVRLGQYDCKSELDYSIDYYIQHNEGSNLARGKYLFAWLLLGKGDYFDAREILLESYLLYKRCNDSIGEARALNRLSYACMQLADLNSAIIYMQRCIDIYVSIGDSINRLVMPANLAAIYFHMGSLKSSIDLYTSLKSNFAACQHKQHVSIYYFQSAVPHAQIGNIQKAIATIEKAKDYITDFPREQAIYYENLGWIHLLAEEYKEAEEALLKGLKISLDIAPKSALVSQIKRRLGDACYGLKQYDKAKRYTDEGLEVARRINERVEIAACYRIYAQLACQNGNENEARDWFKKATDLFAMISSRYELAATRYLAAVSGVYHNGERQAMLYMARDYFQSEEVTPYLEKIDRELAKIKSQPMPRPAPKHSQPPVVIALNPAMKRLVDMAEHVAPSDMNVLLTGPTGAGKDLFARFIHYHSGRTGEFVTVNAAAMPQHMAESEFFGYKKGAYTGADKNTPGLFETADGGTFYLNEIADATPEIQAKLLDVLEHKTVRRLGERTDRKVDFRLIAATNHDIEQLIRDGRFRADLYHRLNEIPITLPALCERPEDIPALLRHFLKPTGVNREEPDLSRLAQVLAAQSWPGNVRQLEAEIKRLAALADSDISKMIEIAQADDLLDKNNLSKTLIRVNWNQSEAAKILGVTEGTIRYRIRKYKLSRPPEFVKDDSCS